MLVEWFNWIGYTCLFIAGLGAVYFLLPGRGDNAAATPPPPPPKQTPQSWARQIDVHCAGAPGHSDRVAQLSLRLADALGLSGDDRRILLEAALLHDLGKLELPSDWFRSADPLGTGERRKLHWHPVLGATHAATLGHELGVVQAIRWHKEHWDGMGYPDGLCGASIPVAARIIALAETTCALLEPRPHREAHTLEQACQILINQGGLAFDPYMTRVLTDFVLPGLDQAQIASIQPPTLTCASKDETASLR